MSGYYEAWPTNFEVPLMMHPPLHPSGLPSFVRAHNFRSQVKYTFWVIPQHNKGWLVQALQTPIISREIQLTSFKIPSRKLLGHDLFH